MLVDAASELPPRDLIRRLLDLGVAGVIVSGGKAIRGPQSTGILAGTPDLIAAAHLNNNPLSAIGRPMKVGKEELCGLVAAVERFFALDEREQLAGWERRRHAHRRRRPRRDQGCRPPSSRTIRTSGARPWRPRPC